jgi:hypothetical protein
MTAVHTVRANVAPTPSAGGVTGDDAYVVRWHEGQKLHRVWNQSSSAWARCPGFTDERVAQAVADSLSAPSARAGR